MSRYLVIIFFFLILVLAACGKQAANSPSSPELNTQTMPTTLSPSSAHFQGIILEINNKGIMVGTGDVDPAASYPAYDILIDDNTEIKGSVHTFKELSVNQKVKIWVKDLGPNNEIDNKVAKKIQVQ